MLKFKGFESKLVNTLIKGKNFRGYVLDPDRMKQLTAAICPEELWWNERLNIKPILFGKNQEKVGSIVKTIRKAGKFKFSDKTYISKYPDEQQNAFKKVLKIVRNLTVLSIFTALETFACHDKYPVVIHHPDDPTTYILDRKTDFLNMNNPGDYALFNYESNFLLITAASFPWIVYASIKIARIIKEEMINPFITSWYLHKLDRFLIEHESAKVSSSELLLTL